MNRRWFGAVTAILTPIGTLFVLTCMLSGAGPSLSEVASADSLNAHSLYTSAERAATENTGVSYCLADFDPPNNTLGSLNSLIAGRGIFCLGDGGDCNGLLSANFTETLCYGDSGGCLGLQYDVQSAGALASYYEYLFHHDTFYDLSSFDELYFWVKGEASTVGDDTTFWLRFADIDWHMGFYTIAGVSDDWQVKTIDIESLKATPDWQDINWHQMREMTIIFENNRDGSGRYAHPLSGTLYFDDIVFVDKDTQVGTDDQLLDLLERRAFHYFWEYADPATGLIRDRATDDQLASIAAVGFGLSSICIAEERGWITYDEAYTRVLTTLNSFYDDPDDSYDFVVSGTHGLFWHFVNIHDGTPMGDGVSTIDSALLMAGVLHSRQHFSGTEVMTLATKIYEAAEWDWFYDSGSRLMYMKWTPLEGYEFLWRGYNEAMILYLLAIGSPTHPIPAASWTSWADSYQWGAYYGYPVLTCPALFTHQYSHCWVDFRGKTDGYANYFQNSRFATLANRAYSRDFWYSDSDIDLWGLTACDGPVAGTCSGKAYRSDLGYPPDTGGNDGTVAPAAAGGSIVFAPEHSIAALRYMYEHHHRRLWGLYGLKDSLNTACEPDWFDNDYVGIDVGAMVVMIENYRSGLVWDSFMRNEEIIEAMEDVGFQTDPTQEPSYFYYQEAEEYGFAAGIGVTVEQHPAAWNEETLQIDWGSDSHPGNLSVYTITVDQEVNSSVFFEIRYSDDVAGDVIDVYLDGNWKGDFTTDEFAPGGWNSFDWDDERINLGLIAPGVHAITLKVAEENGSGLFGVNLDVFRLYTAMEVAKQASPDPVQPGGSLTYTISITNTHNVTLTTTITDILPAQVSPSGSLTWTTSITAPGGVWTEQLTVIVDAGYVGALTNVVQVATAEGVMGAYTHTIGAFPMVGFDSPSYTIGEGSGLAIITVTLSQASLLTATVDYGTADGTATAGEDYTAISGTLVLAPGVTSHGFAITIIGDEVDEGEETILLTLYDPVNATIGEGTAVVTIAEEFRVYLPIALRNYP